MRKCGICNLYVENEAKFCPYCGKRIYTAVSTEFEDEEVKLKSEEYKYNGEIRERYQVVGENGEKIFSFVPDFMVHEFTDGWIYRDELWMSVRYGEKYKVYKIPVNGKKSKLIAEFGDAPAEMFRADEENGDVYLISENNHCICHVSKQGKDVKVMRLLPEQVEKLTGAYVTEIYLNDIFILKNQNNVWYEYADGKLEAINSRFDFETIRKKMIVPVYEKAYYVQPWKIKDLRNEQPYISMYIPERNSMVVCMDDIKENIRISTGEFENEYVYQKEEPERKLMEWETVKEHVPQLVQFFETKELYDSILKNRGYSGNTMRTEIYGVYEYDEHSVVFAVCMAVGVSEAMQVTACYDIDEQTLYWILSSEYKGQDIKETVIKNKGKQHIMPYARYTGMQNLADKKDELFSQHKDYFEKFVNVINKNLEKQAYIKHTKVEKRYSLEQLFKDMYLFLGVIVDDKTISWIYPLAENLAGGNITGFIWVMNLSILGCERAMAVQFNAGRNKIRYYDYLPKATKIEWYQQVKAWFGEEGKIHVLGIPHIPNQEDALVMIPMLGKENLFEVRGTGGGCSGDILQVVTRYNDTYYSGEQTDPMNYIYGNMTVYCKLEGGLVAHPYLTSLRACAYSRQGIFYATKEGAFYLHQNGIRVGINNMTNIMGVRIEGEYVCFKLFKELQQTRWNEHYDTFMGLDEEWRNEYKVITEEIRYSIAEVASCA